jgi:hypothetical protein
LGIIILPARWLKSRAAISQNAKSTSDLSQTSDPFSLPHLLGNGYERADHGSEKSLSGVNEGHRTAAAAPPVSATPRRSGFSTSSPAAIRYRQGEVEYHGRFRLV